jgi:hypothetical protein
MWEYAETWGLAGQLAELLNQWGRQGWEAIGVAPRQQCIVATPDLPAGYKGDSGPSMST